MSALSNADRIRLARLNEDLDVDASQEVASQLVADSLRQQFPDIDDVTIGRILIEVGLIAAQVSQLAPVSLAGFAVAMSHAGLVMTAIEWQEAPR